jgi:YD repeat-containing protein
MRYDLLGRQTHTIDALGGVSYMGYDATGNRTLAQDELGNATYFFFDGLGRTTRVMDATLKSTYMGYDSRSSLVERIDADGRATYMGYDGARRLERQFFANPTVGEVTDSPIYYGYDQVGNRIYTDDRIQGLDLTYFVYDRLDRTTIKRTMAGAVYYAFDKSGMKQELKDADEHLNYHVYDAAGRLDRVVLDGGRTAYYHHDLSGMVLKKLLPDNRVMSYFAYDVAGRLTQLTHCDDTGAPIAYFAYQRNASGTPVWIRRDGGLNQYYEYDALNRLTLDQLNSSSATVYGFRYAYDAASNRSIKTDTVAARATYYTNDARNLLTKEFVLQTGATNYFDHDASRRMTVQRSSTEARYFAYDQGARPTQIRHAAGSPDAIHYFSYNGAGERVRVAEGSTEAYWSYDGSKLIRERRSDDTFGTFRVYRHNKSAADGFGTVLEVESQGFLKESPAQSPPCGKTTRLTAKIDDVIPAVAYYEYDAFGVRQGVSATSGGADTGQRLQFGGNGLIRLGTGPSIYLAKSGLYVAEQGMIVGGSKVRNGDLTPFVPTEDGGSGDADDPRDEDPWCVYGEVQDEPPVFKLKFKFFAGSTPGDGESATQARGRIARGRAFFVEEWRWWEDNVADNCDFKISFEDLGDDIEALRYFDYPDPKGGYFAPVGDEETRSWVGDEKFPPFGKGMGRITVRWPKAWSRVPAPDLIGLVHYVSLEKDRGTTPTPWAWLVGTGMLNALIRSPEPNREYHLGMFETVVGEAERGGDNRPFALVVRGMGVGAFLDKGPMDNITARHEIGHFLGMSGHTQGGIMSYGTGGNRYESHDFKRTFCPLIRAWIDPA